MIALADGVAKELKATYDAVVKTYASVDAKAYSSYLAKDYVYVDPTGKVTKREAYIKEVNELFGSAKSAKLDAKFVKYTVKGDTIVQDFDVHMTLKLKASGVTTMHEVGADTWKKINGKWLEIKTVDKTFDVK